MKREQSILEKKLMKNKNDKHTVYFDLDLNKNSDSRDLAIKDFRTFEIGFEKK